jgi:hypothetical protein
MTLKSIAFGSLAAIALSGATFVSNSLPVRAAEADEQERTRDLNAQQFDTPSIFYAKPAAVADSNYQDSNGYDYSGYNQNPNSDHNNLRNAYDRGYRDGFIRAQHENGFHGTGYDGVGYGPPVGTVGVSFDIGDIAFGYQDGYWDRGRHWHNWQNQDEMQYYRSASGNHYYDYNHDRDSDNGWRQ